MASGRDKTDDVLRKASEAEDASTQNSDGGDYEADRSASESPNGGASETDSSVSQSSDGGATEADCSESQSSDGGALSRNLKRGALSRNSDGGALPKNPKGGASGSRGALCRDLDGGASGGSGALSRNSDGGALAKNSKGGASGSSGELSRNLDGGASGSSGTLSRNSDGGALSRNLDGGASGSSGTLSRNLGGGASEADWSLLQSSDTHYTTIECSVFYLYQKGALGFEGSFDVECRGVPTSWFCEIVLTKVGDDDPTGCIIFKLKRTDSDPTPVGAGVELLLRNVTTETDLQSWGHVQDGLRPGDRIFESSNQDFLIAETERFKYKELRLTTNIEVFSCD